MHGLLFNVDNIVYARQRIDVTVPLMSLVLELRIKQSGANLHNEEGLYLRTISANRNRSATFYIQC